MSTRETTSDTISPVPSMSSNPQYQRLSIKGEEYDDEQGLRTASRSGMVITAGGVDDTNTTADNMMIGSSMTSVVDHQHHVLHDHHHHDDSDHHHHHEETDSLVDEVVRASSAAAASSSGSRNIFRNSWTPSSMGSGGIRSTGSGGGGGGGIDATTSTGMSTIGSGTANSTSRTGSPQHAHHAHSPLPTSSSHGGASLGAAGSSTHSQNHNHNNLRIGLSHASSVEWEDYDDDDDDDFDDDDADAVVRRYHHVVAVSKVPSLPAEFSHNRSMPKRIWASFLELRAAARQRRAARLLTLPSESCSYNLLQATLITWCCDATDRGIALVAVLVLLWLLIGMTSAVSSSAYWWMGIVLFTIRVSARRTYEIFVRKIHQTGRRPHRLSADSMEMSHASSTKASSAEQEQPPPTFRDQSEPRNIV